jgi:Lrp/AsnC family transcriptional regulator
MYDEIDRKILDLLQLDADQPIADIAAAVGLSQTPCWRRIRRMEEDNLIKKKVVLIDRKQANVPMTVFMSVKAPRHAADWLDAFRNLIRNTPEIQEAYRLTGDTDYLLRVVVPDIEHYDEVYKTMISKLEFSDISSSISMEEMKFTTAVPTRYLLMNRRSK